MSYYQVVGVLGLILRLVTLFYATMFIIRYARLRWRTLPEGRHLMGFSVVLAAFMLWSVVNTVMAWVDPTPPTVNPDGHWPGRDEVAVILFGFTAYYMYERNRLLKPEYREDLDKTEDDKHDSRVTSPDEENGVEKWQS